MANRTDREMLHAIIEIIEAHNLNFPHLVKDIRARLTEPEDEPVAYRHLMDDGWEYFDAPTGEDCEGCQKLYRHPSRQLVGLSDEEILAIAEKYGTSSTRHKQTYHLHDGSPTGETYPITDWDIGQEDLLGFARELLDKNQ